MCANPYDECGPMSGHGCSQECGSNVRAGSILSGGPVAAADAGEWSGPITSSAGDSTVVPAQQPKTPAKTESPPAEGWKSSKSAEPQKSGDR
jgi:hypothetical protein